MVGSLALVLVGLAFGVEASNVTCITDPECLRDPGKHGTCRIHTDSGSWSDYEWRNAYTPSADGATYTAHEYGYCSSGKGPWAFSSVDLTVEECADKCASLACKCWDYLCFYREAGNCTCPSIPHVQPKANATKVACVGDSITAGYLSSCGLDYPHQLQTLLGEDYAVTNYGVGGTTLMRKADHPYWNTSKFAQAAASNADIVVLMLGTNDAKRWNWQAHAADFPADYAAMIEVFTSMPSHPVIHLMTPPPLYKDGVYGMNQSVINTELPRLVPQVAKAARLSPPISLFELWEGHCPVKGGTPGHPPNATDVRCEWIAGPDGCHPDNMGYGKIASAVHDAIVAS